MSKFIRDYSRNSIVVNLLGDEKHIDTAAHDITKILKKKDLSYKIISLRPTILSLQSNNNMPEWRFQIDKEIRSDENIIINKVGRVNCDEITDLNRSIRALSHNRYPIALYVEPNAISRCQQNNSHKFNSLKTCSQISTIFPLNGTDETKTYEFEIFLDSYMVEIKE